MNNFISDQTNIDIDIEIWISSHIHSKQRYEWARETLKSLHNQTYPNFKIFISWSKESYIDTNLNDIITSTDRIKSIIFYHQQRKTQFEHLRFIYENRSTPISSSNKTFVLFCDDDDLYHPSRVETIIKTINLCPDIKVIRDYKIDIDGFYKTTDLPVDIVFFDFENNNSLNILSLPHKYDFGNYGCDLNLIIEFFDNNMDHEIIKLSHCNTGISDCFFTQWLENYETPQSIIKNIMYFKRSARSLETLSMCWHLDKNYNFENLIDTYNLKTIFCTMSL